MTTVLFKDIRPGDVFTVTYQWGGETHRVTYCMNEDRTVHYYPLPEGFSSMAIHTFTRTPLHKCERHCPGLLHEDHPPQP